MERTPSGPVVSALSDVVGWDVLTFSTAVEYWESVLSSTEQPLDCLELGAGPGGPSLWLALKGHRVLCSNWQNTREQAQPLHARYRAEGIRYEDIDARSIPYENRFDVIVFKSMLGGVGGVRERREAIAQMHKALKPGGMLLFAENTRSTVVHRAARALAYRLRGTSWSYPTVSELRELLGGFSRHELHSTGVLAMFGPTERLRRGLAVIDRAIVNRITPSRWRYVGYGFALK